MQLGKSAYLNLLQILKQVDVSKNSIQQALEMTLQWHHVTLLQLKVTQTRHEVYGNKFLNTLLTVMLL